jgi:dipeptidyl aminopeptidase/acylaminoacyl peptidase
MPAAPEDLYALRLPGSPDLAPGGGLVAAAVQRVSGDHGAYRSQLWLFPAHGPGEPTPLTGEGQWSDTAPAFSPDGCRVAFISTRGGTAAACVTAADGSGTEPRRAADITGPVTAVRWLDDARLVILTEPRPAPPPPGSPVRIDWLRYKSDGARSFTEPEPELWLLPLDGPPVSLARPAGRITRLAVGGGRVAYTVEPRHCDEPRPGAQVRVLDVAAGTDELWWDCPAPVADLAFTAASGHLVAVSSGVPGQSAEPPRVWLVWPGGARVAFAAADVECERALTGDCRPLGRPALVQPLAGSDEIAYLHTLGYDVALFAGDPAAGAAGHPSAGGAPRRLTPEGWSVTDFSAGAHGRLAACLESPVSPAEVHLIDTSASAGPAGSAVAPRRISAVAQSWAGQLRPVAPEDVAVTGPDGTEVHGLLYRAGPGPRPLVVRLHGGPHLTAGHAFDHEAQLLAGAGYSVLAPNLDGSAGRGTGFRQRSVGRWGQSDFGEVMAFTDWAVASGAAAEARLYLAGGSYGGYLVNWALTRTTRFRAAISERSVSNLLSKFGTSDNGFTVNRFEFGGADIYDDGVRVLLDRSPLLHASAIRTPLLLIHGEADQRCPVEQSEQLFVALRRLRREAVFLRFPGESHGLSTAGRPDHRVARLAAVLDWLDGHPS